MNVTLVSALLRQRLDSGQLAVIVARRNCLLAAGRIREYERCDGESS